MHYVMDAGFAFSGVGNTGLVTRRSGMNDDRYYTHSHNMRAYAVQVTIFIQSMFHRILLRGRSRDFIVCNR